MSNIVFLGVPAHGHINPTLPVIQELVRREERVICYNGEEFRSKIEETGATFRAYPKSDLTGAMLADVVQGGNLANATALILRATGDILPGLLEALPSEKPDLLMFDSLALWGKMASTMLKVRGGASITHFIMELQHAHLRWWEIILMARQFLPSVPSILLARNRLIRRFGKGAYPNATPLFPMRGAINLVFTARALHPDILLLDETFHFVGPSLNPQPDAAFPFDTPKGEKVIYLSLGTIHHAPAEFYLDCFRTFADYPAQFIVSVGHHTNIETLGDIPANFNVHPFVPQVAVLQHTDVFITHGGMNSVHEGLYYGVPLVIIPHQFEQLLNARCIAQQGAAVVVMDQMQRGRFTAATVREAVDCVLRESGYRTAAQRVQKILRATGGYRQAADEIQAYLNNGQ